MTRRKAQWIEREREGGREGGREGKAYLVDEILHVVNRQEAAASR